MTMKPALLSVVTPVLLLAWAGQGVLAADPDTASPLVSYQYLDSLAEPPDQVNVVSPLVSYQYLDSIAEPPGHANVVSALVSFDYNPRYLTEITLDGPGTIVGGSVGAVTGVFSPRPSYAYPYRGYAGYRGCRWIPAHHNSYGQWRAGHCARY